MNSRLPGWRLDGRKTVVVIVLVRLRERPLIDIITRLTDTLVDVLEMVTVGVLVVVRTIRNEVEK